MNEGIGNFFAPITLIIGGGLLALGVLALFDLSFFKTKLQARIALAVGLAFVVATEAMFVTGSSAGRYFAGQSIDVTDCEYEVETANPEERGKASELIANGIKQCMARLGYDWITEHPHCEEAKIATNVFCYLPRTAMSRAIVAFQMKFE